MTHSRWLRVTLWIVCAVAGLWPSVASAQAAKVRSFMVDGVKRDALVIEPSKPSAHPPIVFAWHGHGGNMNGGPGLYGVEAAWPEAIVVYPQGLPSPTAVDPQGTKPGWQFSPGDQGDRDLHFFDAMYGNLGKQLSFDPKRVYSLGFSNGGIFSYLLWHSRASKLAAVGICEAPLIDTNKLLAPVAAFVIAGKQDTTVPFSAQQTAIASVKAADGVAPDAQPSSVHGGVAYFSGAKADVAVDIHNGGHVYPAGRTALVAAFFKKHPRP